MKLWQIIGVLFVFVVSPCIAQPVTLTGSSGKSIASYGIPQQVMGIWMGRSSWQDLHDGNWLWVAQSGLPAWRKQYFNRPVDIGVPLIPTDSKTDYDTLLRQAAHGLQDSTYIGLGKMLARYGTKTVYARLWWEFNMYPVKQSPKWFIAAWRRAVPLLRHGFNSEAAPGQALQIVWCTNAGPPNPEPFYPGNDVVDVIGTDVYGMVWGNADPTVEQMLSRLKNGPYMLGWLKQFA